MSNNYYPLNYSQFDFNKNDVYSNDFEVNNNISDISELLNKIIINNKNEISLFEDSQFQLVIEKLNLKFYILSQYISEDEQISNILSQMFFILFKIINALQSEIEKIKNNLVKNEKENEVLSEKIKNLKFEEENKKLNSIEFEKNNKILEKPNLKNISILNKTNKKYFEVNNKNNILNSSVNRSGSGFYSHRESRGECITHSQGKKIENLKILNSNNKEITQRKKILDFKKRNRTINNDSFIAQNSIASNESVKNTRINVILKKNSLKNKKSCSKSTKHPKDKPSIGSNFSENTKQTYMSSGGGNSVTIINDRLKKEYEEEIENLNIIEKYLIKLKDRKK